VVRNYGLDPERPLDDDGLADVQRLEDADLDEAVAQDRRREAAQVEPLLAGRDELRLGLVGVEHRIIVERIAAGDVAVVELRKLKVLR